MTHDDDTILSAYLDGQLGPEEQHAVEAALLDDSRLAEELRALALVRELVAALPREPGGDVSGRVMRRVRRRALFRTASRGLAWGPLRTAIPAAIAAGLVAVFALPWLIQPAHRDQGRRPGTTAHYKPALAAPRPVLDSRWPRFANQSSIGGDPQPAVPGERRAAPPVKSVSPRTASGESSHVRDVREYLDNPQLRRIFLVSDLDGGSTGQQVASIVEQTTRFNYYKITVSRGVLIDPRHPDQATVFALVVGPRELDDLRERLRAALKDRVEEKPVDRSIVTHLAEAHAVEACSPAPQARIPGDSLAMLRDDHNMAPDEQPEAGNSERPAAHNLPTREQERSSPRGEPPPEARGGAADGGAWPGGRPAGDGHAPAAPGPSHEAEPTYVVLVWVSRPES